MGCLSTADQQKPCLLGYSLTLRLQLFVLFFSFRFVLLCLQCCTILTNDFFLPGN